MIQQIMSQHEWKPGELVKLNSTNGVAVILSEQSRSFLSITYTLKVLKLSNFWPIRKMQIWVIKKAFK